ALWMAIYEMSHSRGSFGLMASATRSPGLRPRTAMPRAIWLDRACHSRKRSSRPSPRFFQATPSGNWSASSASRSTWMRLMMRWRSRGRRSVRLTALEDGAWVLHQHALDIRLAHAALSHDRQHVGGDIRPAPIPEGLH